MEHSFLYNKKILLVDDEPDLLKLVSDILTDDGLKHFKIIPSKNNKAIGMINEIYLASLKPCIL